ncbi:MAG: hypothetical protein WCG06_06400, partial [Candidatus Omnitrophota bacterium]
TKEIVEKAQTYLNNPQSAHRIRGIMSEQARVRHSQQQLMFGRRYLLKHDYASANSLFEEAASIDPKNERAFYYLSLAQQALNATRESQVSLKTARSLAGLKKRIRSQVDRAALKELDKSG